MVMKLSFALYSTNTYSQFSVWQDAFLDSLSGYVTTNNDESAINELLIGLIVIEESRSQEALFKPRRNQFIECRPFKNMWGDNILIERSLQYEMQINTDVLYSLNTAHERGTLIITALCASLAQVRGYAKRKKLEIDFDCLEKVIRSFPLEAPPRS